MASELLATVSVRTGQASGAATGAVANKPALANQPVVVRQSTAPTRGKDLPPEDSAEAAKAAEATKDSAENLAAQVHKLNEYAQQMKRDIEFSVDEESNRTIVRVRDAETGEVIRQLPAEEILRIAERLADAEGLLVREQA